MELYDKLFTQFPTNLSKHNATGRLQHPIRHPLNVRSADLHVRSHAVATAANPTSRMNRALKQQANQLGPNTQQQCQEMLNMTKRSTILYSIISAICKWYSSNVGVRPAAGWITDISFTFLTKTFRMYQTLSYPVCANGCPWE